MWAGGFCSQDSFRTTGAAAPAELSLHWTMSVCQLLWSAAPLRSHMLKRRYKMHMSKKYLFTIFYPLLFKSVWSQSFAEVLLALLQTSGLFHTCRKADAGENEIPPLLHILQYFSIIFPIPCHPHQPQPRAVTGESWSTGLSHIQAKIKKLTSSKQIPHTG